jgi:ABC-2 type transport system ATP-binding protein
MPEGQLLEFSGVTKRFGAVTAVSGLTARVEPGRVTGFLGPNGAGKTTTLRILLGLVSATEGSATIGGERYVSLDHPLQTVGAVLEASSFHPGRTAANHLKVYAQAAGLPTSRVDDVLGLVGLGDVGGRKVGGFSLGMRQRLGLAYALLGDPGVLVLDEPANGLDPEGIKWMRVFLRDLAREGRTVLVSSHMLSEVQQTVDALLIVSQGRLVYQGGLENLADPSEYVTVVDSPDRAALGAALTSADVSFDLLRSGLTVRGLDPVEVGGIAASAGVALSSLQRRGPALEEVFLELISGVRVHATASGAAETEGAGDAVDPAVDTDAVAAGAAVGDAEYAAIAAATAAELDAEASAVSGAAAATGAAAGAESSARPEARATAGFAVASTGVIDIVPVAAARPAEGDGLADDATTDDEPLDGDVDVEALGEIDDELNEPEPTEDTDRPWEHYEKTEADADADAFFAAFTDDAEPEPESEPEPQPKPEPSETDDADSPDVLEQGDRAPALEGEADEEARTDEGSEHR